MHCENIVDIARFQSASAPRCVHTTDAVKSLDRNDSVSSRSRDRNCSRSEFRFDLRTSASGGLEDKRSVLVSVDFDLGPVSVSKVWSRVTPAVYSVQRAAVRSHLAARRGASPRRSRGWSRDRKRWSRRRRARRGS